MKNKDIKNILFVIGFYLVGVYCGWQACQTIYKYQCAKEQMEGNNVR